MATTEEAGSFRIRPLPIEALKECPSVEKVIVVKRLGLMHPLQKRGILWWHEEMAKEDIVPNCEPAVMDAEDPLFLLYTSRSADKPRRSHAYRRRLSLICFIRL